MTALSARSLVAILVALALGVKADDEKPVYVQGTVVCFADETRDSCKCALVKTPDGGYVPVWYPASDTALVRNGPFGYYCRTAPETYRPVEFRTRIEGGTTRGPGGKTYSSFGDVGSTPGKYIFNVQKIVVSKTQAPAEVRTGKQSKGVNPFAPDNSQTSPENAVGNAGAQKPPPAAKAVPAPPAPEMSTAFVGSRWNWCGNPNEVVEFKADKTVYNKGWSDRGIVTTWEFTGKNQLRLTVVKGKTKELEAILNFTEDRKSFTGTNFDGKGIAPSGRILDNSQTGTNALKLVGTWVKDDTKTVFEIKSDGTVLAPEARDRKYAVGKWVLQGRNLTFIHGADKQAFTVASDDLLEGGWTLRRK